MTQNFATLKAALNAATRAHYKKLVAGNPSEKYYGYSLYTSDDVDSIGPVANAESSISYQPSDPMFIPCKYGPHEWRMFDDFGLFDEANQIIKALSADPSLSFDQFRDGALACALEVLKELEAEGMFGPRTDDRFVVLWISDSNDPIMNQAAKELNSPNAYAAYASEYAAQI